jgi:hypothetical protein
MVLNIYLVLILLEYLHSAATLTMSILNRVKFGGFFFFFFFL